MFCRIVVLIVALGLACSYPSSTSTKLRYAINSSRFTHSKSKVGIYNGSNATIAEYPYLASIMYDNQIYQTGAILNEKWVITIATLIYWFDANDLRVVAGSSDGLTGNSYQVKKIVFHPDYDYTTLDYDYALLRLKGKLKWSDTVGKVSLPTKKPSVGTTLTVAGWGDPVSGIGYDEGKSALQQGKMSWFNLRKCKKLYSDFNINFTSRVGCVYNQGKTTLCDGDFGDPLVKDGVLYGLGKDGAAEEWCTSEAMPVVVSSIHAVVDWIKNTTGIEA